MINPWKISLFWDRETRQMFCGPSRRNWENGGWGDLNAQPACSVRHLPCLEFLCGKWLRDELKASEWYMYVLQWYRPEERMLTRSSCSSPEVQTLKTEKQRSVGSYMIIAQHWDSSHPHPMELILRSTPESVWEIWREWPLEDGNFFSNLHSFFFCFLFFVFFFFMKDTKY